ncbi:DEAD/H associated domain protein [Thermogladius calderae 1633]|uniref:DEAD/H associated domain protein n=1 Tax=Thermogladius calderae (strain DSM 22663 / VKM B-2946 / 1633) TaxID=1184251 RepID=I3TFN6_THEC1|nr:ATP-dependent helicase [Thermogladius calderae]AFK51574.1 DEAD/H associated domain protein [Thermogladius calderae 1633]
MEYAKDNLSDDEVLGMLLPFVRAWFTRKYGRMTPPQRMAIPYIMQGRNVLISSPTGTGKTLAVFLGIINNLYKEYLEKGGLPEGIVVVYVSPLRALNNDMRRNIYEPVKEIVEEARRQGVELPEIKVAVRTSDSKQSEKQRMLRDPPHILITTPESLALSLNAPKFSERLKNARVVVVDEIHELASSKRGSHLSLSIERLENLTGRELQRIGLSATIAPLEDVALFLVGYRNGEEPRDCVVVDARFAKPIDIRVIAPVKDLIHTPADAVNEAIYKSLIGMIKRHKTTLVFTNTRSATERVVYKLRKLMESEKVVDVDEVEAHHSSLSRDVRLEIEEKLKSGALKCVVSSTSLELGIDIGHIDLVVLLSSPKSVTRLLQRVGRAGHHIREVSKGRLIVVDRDDLVECAVLAKAAMERKIDKIRIPRNPLDVLAQHVVGMALERKWGLREAYELVRRSYSFRDLPYEDFVSVVKYLAGQLGDFYEYNKVYSKIWLDEEEGVFGKKKSTRMIYYLNLGVIPDESKAHVFTTEGKYVGDLEEAFVEYLAPGDLFVLGGRVYEYLGSKGLKVLVRRADGARPTVPSWFSEMLPLAFDSALLVGRFRRAVADKLARDGFEEAVRYVAKEYNLDKDAARSIAEYVWEQYSYTGGLIPSDKLILIEVFDEEDRRNVIVHSLFGRRANDALSRAYAYIVSKTVGANVKITVTDNGFMLTLPGHPSADWVGLFKSINPDELYDILVRVLRRTELLKRRFRHVATRSFMLLRRYRDVERSIQKLQVNAEELLKAVEEIDNFPVLRETYREILEDYMHIDEARKVLEWVREGEVEVRLFGPVDVPSPFAHSIVVHGYSDVVLMEDMRRMLAILYDQVMEKLRKLGVQLQAGGVEEVS